jgi:hypothetical protein
VFANRCHHPSVRGLLSERYIRRIDSKSAREWLQLTIRLSAPDMPDGAAKHGKTECHPNAPCGDGFPWMPGVTATEWQSAV